MNTSELAFRDGRLFFTDSSGAGWHGINFELNGTLSTTLSFDLCEKDGGFIATGRGAVHTERIEVMPAGDGAITLRRVITNSGNAPLVLASMTDGILDEQAQVKLARSHEYTIRCMHTGNIRTEQFPNTRPQFSYIQPVPYVPATFNVGEANDIPAVVLCAEDSILQGANYQSLLVEADLDQSRFLRSWEIGLDGAGPKSRLLRTWLGRQHYALAAPFELAPGESVQVAHLLYQILHDTHPQDALDLYIEILGRYHHFRGQQSAMLEGAVFCTWNFGTFGNIDEGLLATRAEALATRIPECTHFLIDDGYQADRGNRNGPLDCFYPTPAERYDRVKFPSGMKAMADKIRAFDLTPCIWLSPAVYLDSALAREHADWLLCDADGDPALLGKSTFLDLSVDEARAFFLEVLDALFVEWGFRGIKFDFMTQWFSLPRARFRTGSGLEWREWAYAEIRRRIGDDGLFMTCIAMSMGNPFPGRHADCYRCGCDIHDCTWPEQLKACKATLPQILLEGRKTLLLNMDSAGLGEVPEHEQFFRLTWVFITQGILELGGKIEQMPLKQTNLLRRLCANADRGHRVRCLDERAFTGDGMPEILRVDYPENSLTWQRGIRSHVAFFNWEERVKPIGGDREFLGIPDPAPVFDYWSGEQLPDGNVIIDLLQPHAARLLEIRH